MHDPISPPNIDNRTAEPDAPRALELATFNRELAHRLASLDRREYVDPALIRARLAAKSAERRKLL